MKSNNVRNVLLPKQVFCQYVGKRFDTSAFNWHKIQHYYGPKSCPTTSTSWAPRFPLVGGRQPPNITSPSYTSLPEEEDSLLKNGFEGVRRCDEYLSSSSVRLGSRTDIFRWIEQGRITVNGKVLHTPTYISAGDDILFDNHPISEIAQRTFLLFKPSIGLTIHPKKDLGGKPDWIYNLPPIVSGNRDGAMDMWFLLPPMHTRQEGLLMLTNDYALAQKIQTPDIQLTYKFDLSVVGSTIRCDQLALDCLATAYQEERKCAPVSLTRIPDVDTVAQRDMLLLKESNVEHGELTPLEEAALDVENRKKEVYCEEDAVIVTGRASDLAHFIPRLTRHLYGETNGGKRPLPIRRTHVGPFALGDLQEKDVRDVSPLVSKILPSWYNSEIPTWGRGTHTNANLPQIVGSAT